MSKKFTQAEYTEYLQSSQWQTKRKQKAEEQNYTCQICHKRIDKGFHIHHKTYRRFKKERLTDLMFLCEDCHEQVHKTQKKGKRRRYMVNAHKNSCRHCGGVTFYLKKKWLLSRKYGVYCKRCNKLFGWTRRK